jgi:hypothetical protein
LSIASLIGITGVTRSSVCAFPEHWYENFAEVTSVSFLIIYQVAGCAKSGRYAAKVLFNQTFLGVRIEQYQFEAAFLYALVPHRLTHFPGLYHFTGSNWGDKHRPPDFK